MLWAVTPLKCGGQVKQRLAEVFSADERLELSRAMARDVLAALGACPEVEGVLLLSSDAAAQQLAVEAGAEHAADPGGGLNDVAAAAAQMVEERGGSHMLFVHADLPASDAAEFSGLIAELKPEAGPALCLAEDRRGQGTNALLCAPPGLIAFQYGPGSAQKHIEAAQAQGAAARRCFFPGLSLDVDTPEDLRELLRRFGDDGRAVHTLAVLAAPQMRRRLAQ